MIWGVMALYLAGVVMFSRWCIDDAGRRGCSRVFVLPGVVGCFPIGWMIWLICRPPVQKSFVGRFVGTQKSLRGNVVRSKKKDEARQGFVL